MPITTGINHVAFLTDDVDALIDFYTSVFDAEVLADLQEGPLRHAMVDIGGHAALHAFQRPDSAGPTSFGPVFERGHLDHIALDVADEEAFELVRRRLVDRAATDGTVTDFGRVRSVSFVDPDGWEGEVALWQDGPILTFDERIQEPYVAAVRPS
jgi:catechol 2,3-dioxygenase-like lactoylglutathione lyase family enzyme